MTSISRSVGSASRRRGAEVFSLATILTLVTARVGHVVYIGREAYRSVLLRCRDVVVHAIILRLDAVHEGFFVNHQVKASSSVRGKLAENNILCNSRERVVLSKEGGFK